ncbi:MAG: MoeZ/MoeB [Planctomycetaceae bacterium]|nr:MoeZ/MoeB [Planctomycetaceae bacterium]
MWVNDFGEAGQSILKSSCVLVTRVGGLGSVVAYELAAAGVGHLVLAHAGNIKFSDLNRQLLMTHARVGTPRVDCAAERLRELNPHIQITTWDENATCGNIEKLCSGVDLIVDCAPLFSERFALNRAAVEKNIPLVECAMYELEFQLTSIQRGTTACLRCLYPEAVGHWNREFPVFGAVSGSVGALGAMEAIKILTGIGKPLHSRLLRCDLRTMEFQTVQLQLDPNCPVCGSPPER